MKLAEESTKLGFLSPNIEYMGKMKEDEKRKKFTKTKTTNIASNKSGLTKLHRKSASVITQSKVAQKQLSPDNLTPTNMLNKTHGKDNIKLSISSCEGMEGNNDKQGQTNKGEIIEDIFGEEEIIYNLPTEEMKDTERKLEKNPTLTSFPVNNKGSEDEQNNSLGGEEADNTQEYREHERKKVAKPSQMKRIIGISSRKLLTERHRTEIRAALGIKTFVILPDDPFKIIWSSFMLLLLIYATTVTPYRVAFVDQDSIVWIIIDSIVDFFFLCDLVLNFFFAYYDEDEELVFDRKKLAIKYLKTWFLIDLVAIIPFNFMFAGDRDYSSLSRLARLPRLYRLLKITKILKTVRVCREKSSWLEYAPQMSVAGERLIAFVIIVIVFVHVTACFWYLLAKVEGIYPNSWVIRYGYQDSSNFSIYTASIYFTVTTITTVGYGDLTAHTTAEQWFCTLTMVIGVMCYSFCISSLSSILTSYDIKETNKNKALQSLHRIDCECKLDTNTFLKIKKAIIKKFKQVEYIVNRDHLMTLLPRNLRSDLNAAMHVNLVRKVNIFKEENDTFVEYIARLLKPFKYPAESIICQENSPIDEIYFILKGSVEYVLPEYNDAPYWKISKGERFGDLEILRWFSGGRKEQEKRIFTAKAKEECEILVLSKTDLFLLYKKYQEQTKAIFQGSDLRLQHTKNLKARAEKKFGQRHKEMNDFIKEMSLGRPGPGLQTGYTRRFSDSIHSEEDSSFESSSFTSSDFSAEQVSLDNKDLSNKRTARYSDGLGKLGAEIISNRKHLKSSSGLLNVRRRHSHRNSSLEFRRKSELKFLGLESIIQLHQALQTKNVKRQKRKEIILEAEHFGHEINTNKHLPQYTDFTNAIIKEETNESENSPSHHSQNIEVINESESTPAEELLLDNEKPRLHFCEGNAEGT